VDVDGVRVEKRGGVWGVVVGIGTDESFRIGSIFFTAFMEGARRG